MDSSSTGIGGKARFGYRCRLIDVVGRFVGVCCLIFMSDAGCRSSAETQGGGRYLGFRIEKDTSSP